MPSAHLNLIRNLQSPDLTTRYPFHFSFIQCKFVCVVTTSMKNRPFVGFACCRRATSSNFQLDLEEALCAFVVFQPIQVGTSMPGKIPASQLLEDMLRETRITAK